MFFSAPEGRRSSGLNAIWVARNRFAVLDKNHVVSSQIPFPFSFSTNISADFNQKQQK